uniref:CSON010750 protein n=1 Tax=Culicoides sonorensis TaxID=179676 RepID=A0A336M2S5_CULSO
MKVTQKTNTNLKFLSLFTLTVQNAVLGLSMRYARTRSGPMFLSSSAVLMSEVVKLLTCLIVVFVEEGRSFKRFKAAINNTIVRQPIDTLKICVPSFVYIIQNNLLYLSASHLDAATYQVTYQLKILTTAFFAVLILRRRLLPTQWGALIFLILGVVLVQLANGGETPKPTYGMPEQNKVIGFSAALAACFLSGFAGIYFEKMLKGADISVWMRNVQLSLLSLPFGLITCYANDYEKITQHGLFYGYDYFVDYLVVLQAGGGLIVAMVVKYADNILKGFATSLAIIISCIASIYIFDFVLTLQFAAGAGLVIFSIFMYGYTPKNQQSVGVRLNEDQKQLMDAKV